jgi:5-methyltetrahydrofolate--homocysteine methyltransferase
MILRKHAEGSCRKGRAATAAACDCYAYISIDLLRRHFRFGRVTLVASQGTNGCTAKRYDLLAMATLSELLATKELLLIDGATGTNYFERGLVSGEPPELWNVDHPQRVTQLYREFVEAGSDIILTNTFGCNRHRMKLHGAQDRVYEIAKRSAELARAVVDSVDRPVVVAGSVGPTGELFEPLGALTEAAAIASFTEEIEGLKAGGADVAWIETKSSIEEVRAAAQAAINCDMAYTATLSFDTAGRTMMGLLPEQIPAIFDGLAVPPLAMGANCGVGAPDILVTILRMSEATGSTLIVKTNCGVPHFVGTEAVYSGTPELMADYVHLAANAGARIIGGCCGTTPKHVDAMRESMDHWTRGPRPTIDDVVASLGQLVNAAPTANPGGEGRDRSARRRRG